MTFNGWAGKSLPAGRSTCAAYLWCAARGAYQVMHRSKRHGPVAGSRTPCSFQYGQVSPLRRIRQHGRNHGSTCASVVHTLSPREHRWERGSQRTDAQAETLVGARPWHSEAARLVVAALAGMSGMACHGDGQGYDGRHERVITKAAQHVLPDGAASWRGRLRAVKEGVVDYQQAGRGGR